MAGSNCGPWKPRPGAIQKPPGSGVPPNSSTRLKTKAVGHTWMLASTPASGCPPTGFTDVMVTPTVEVLITGQAPSFTCMSRFTGLWATSPAQHTVTVIGLAPATDTVEPGKSVAACEEMASTSPASGSENTSSKQNGAPLHTSMVLFPMNSTPAVGPDSAANPCTTGGTLVHGRAMSMMSRITEPMNTPLASYWSTCTTNTYFPMAPGVNEICPEKGSMVVPGTGTVPLNPAW